MLLIEFLQTSPTAFIVVAAILGLLVGSFLNVVIHRLPQMMEAEWRQQCAELGGQAIDADAAPAINLMTPRSRCPHCGHAITALENIPVLSYLVLGGKCSACAKPISVRYPVIETLSGVLTAAVAGHFGWGWQAGAAMLLTWALLALSVIDFDHQLLPDTITQPFIWLGLALSLFGGGVFVDARTSIIGALAGYLSLWLVYQLFKRLTGKEGMGYGDFKLFALFGAWLGWQLLPAIILLSSLVGAIVGISLIVVRGRDRNLPIPFGPYLAAAGWIALLWGERMTNAYLRMAGVTS